MEVRDIIKEEVENIVLDGIIDLLEGVGDKYAERKWGIPNPDTAFQTQTQPAMRGNENGEMVGYALDTSYDSREPDTRNPIYKNPTSLRNFEAGVRAVSDTKGNLWVGQTNGDYYHGSMKSAIKVVNDIYYWGDAITWLRVGTTNKFGLGESSFGWGTRQNSEFQKVFQDNLAAVQRQHPNFEFDVETRDGMQEGVGDAYAEKQFGIPNQDDEFEKQYQQHKQTNDRDIENGELMGQIESVDTYEGEPNTLVNVYKNPKSLKNFGDYVRAITDSQGNIYVAQIDGSFYHQQIIDLVPATSGYEDSIQLYRVGNSNLFGVAGTYYRYATGNSEGMSVQDYKDFIESHTEAQREFREANKRNPSFDISYYPAYMLNGNNIGNQDLQASILKHEDKPQGDKTNYFEGAALGDSSGYMQMVDKPREDFD